MVNTNAPLSLQNKASGSLLIIESPIGFNHQVCRAGQWQPYLSVCDDEDTIRDEPPLILGGDGVESGFGFQEESIWRKGQDMKYKPEEVGKEVKKEVKDL
jgi:hypothetical protein